jgi:CheY-like chemotaxis protein
VEFATLIIHSTDRFMENKPIHILLADDDKLDRLFFKDAFEEIDIKTVVNTVNDGIELINYLHSPEDSLPDVLFLDLNMPRKSGLECLKEIKSNQRFKDITIAIYSTSALENEVEDAFVNGANVYIKKPGCFTKLKNILSEMLSINWHYQTSGLNRENFLLNL